MVIHKEKFNAKYVLFFIVSYFVMGFGGFLLGIYTLPLITAEGKPSQELSDLVKNDAIYEANFVKDLKGSDFLHWGDGKILISKEKILFQGDLSPGPNYKLYFTKTFVSDEEGFLHEQGNGLKIGSINSFNGFLLELPKDINLENYTSVVIWCESFSEFITAAQYRN